jgi:AcrR family transcriptional regulator
MGIQERREREKLGRRNAIIEAARKLFLEKGIEHATMKEIAREAGLSKAALYLYFQNKEELTFELLHISLTKIRELIDSAAERGRDGYSKLSAAAEEFRRMFREEPEYIYFSLVMERYASSIANNLLSSQKCLELIMNIQNRMEELIREGIEDGSVRADLDPQKTAALLFHMATSFMQRVSLMQESFIKYSSYTAQELIDHMFTVFIHVLR